MAEVFSKFCGQQWSNLVGADIRERKGGCCLVVAEGLKRSNNLILGSRDSSPNLLDRSAGGGVRINLSVDEGEAVKRRIVERCEGIPVVRSKTNALERSLHASIASERVTVCVL